LKVTPQTVVVVEVVDAQVFGQTVQDIIISLIVKDATMKEKHGNMDYILVVLMTKEIQEAVILKNQNSVL
jgi:hypothetical protein